MNSDSKDKDDMERDEGQRSGPLGDQSADYASAPGDGMPTGDVPTEDTVSDEESHESPDAPEEGSDALGVLKGPRFALLRKTSMSPGLRVASLIVLFCAALFVLVLLGSAIFSRPGKQEQYAATPDVRSDGAPGSVTTEAGMMELKIYYPVGRRITPETRKVAEATKAKAIAEAVVMEFLKGPSSEQSGLIPRGAALIDVFLGSDGMLYLNFTSSMSLNFQGDALGEFLLLRSLYKSVNENVYGINGIKVLVEGIEVETVGGHITLKGDLADVVSYSLTPENK